MSEHENNITHRIIVATDFSDAPGARYSADGPKSGEEFLIDFLRPKFLEAKKLDGALLIDLDGTWGYASSFISGSFGALAREFGAALVHKHLLLKSIEDEVLLEKVNREIDTEGQRV